MNRLARKGTTLKSPDVPGNGTGQPVNVIQWQGVCKRFWKGREAKTILSDVSLDVRRGEFLTVVGPSGCGKTTLLNIAAGLTRASAGRVLYDGAEVRGVNRRVGYLTQKDTLLPWRRVRDNVMLPLQVQGMPARQRRAAADDILGRVGLADFKEHYPAELSGGMRRRVLIARTLVYHPETLLMDEPFVALDAQTQLRLQNDLLRLWAEEPSLTVVFVTHDLAEAVALADRVVILARPPHGIRYMRDVQIERPRDVRAVRGDPRFGKLHDDLWRGLDSAMSGDGDEAGEQAGDQAGEQAAHAAGKQPAAGPGLGR
jgi:NitT/TauT family transport system ATP-binding protein